MISSSIDRIEQMVKALRPVLGDRANNYKKLWLSADRKGREEVEHLLQLEYNQQFPDSDQIVLPPPVPDSLPGEGIEVGKILYQGKESSTLHIPPQALLRHLMIAGATGTGKTTLLFQICKELLRMKIPFFLFDFKLDYRPLLELDKNVQVYTVGSMTRPLGFNPLLEISKALVRVGHLRDLNPLFQLTDVLCRVFYTGHGVRSLLNKCFAQLLHDWVDHQYSSEYEPTFRRAYMWVKDYEPKTEKGMRFREWKVSTLRVLEMLSMGTFGDSINASNDLHVPLQDLRSQTVVFELNLPTDLKTFFVESLLLCARLSNIEGLKSRGRGQLQNCMIIDESHNLLKEGYEKIESQLQIALREDRGLGTAYIIADQTPSQLDNTAYANTCFKFFFALDQADDLLVASKSLLFDPDERKHLSKLPAGQAICRYGSHNAFLVSTYPMDSIKHTIISDDQINELSAKQTEDKSQFDLQNLFEDLNKSVVDFTSILRETNLEHRDSAESSEKHREVAENSAKQPSMDSDKVVSTSNSIMTDVDSSMTEVEKSLLEDILREPFAGIIQHFKNIGVSTANGKKTRQRLEERGLLDVKAIRLGDKGGQLHLAALTEQGTAFLRAQGKEAHWPYFQNGGEHEYWKEMAARHFRNKGYGVKKEQGINGHADLTATRGEEHFAIEIETGKSDIKANIEKYRDKGFAKIILIATNKPIIPRLDDLARNAVTQGLPVEVWPASQVIANSS